MPTLALVVPAFTSLVVVGLLSAQGAAPVHKVASAAASPGSVSAPGSVSLNVPLVATTASDGLKAVLRPGRYRVSLPVWEASGGPALSAVLTASGAASHACAAVRLRPGAVVRLSCDVEVPGGAQQVVVTVRAGTVQVARWTHRGG